MLFSKELFLNRYNDLHQRIIPNVLKNYSPSNLRTRKRNMNSPIWILWHMIRTEDVGVNRFVTNNIQIYEQYKEIVNYPTTFNGTGMKMQEVHQISEMLSMEGLMKYQKAVYENTLGIVNKLEFDLNKEKVTKEQIDQIICHENTMPEEAWVLLDLYYGKSKEWFLLHVCLTHPFYHLGQLSTISKLLT